MASNWGTASNTSLGSFDLALGSTSDTRSFTINANGGTIKFGSQTFSTITFHAQNISAETFAAYAWTISLPRIELIPPSGMSFNGYAHQEKCTVTSYSGPTQFNIQSVQTGAIVKINWSSSISYTDPTPPSSVWITYNNKTVYAGSGNILTVPTGVGFKLSWSGAKKGDNNNITGYNIREWCSAGGGTFDNTTSVNTSNTYYNDYQDSLGYFNSSAINKTYSYTVQTKGAMSNSVVSQEVKVMPVAAAVTYTISYNANGGSVSPSSDTGTYGGTIDLPLPTRTGYIFKGWYTNHTASTSTAYDYGKTYKYPGSVSLSFWTDAESYTNTTSNTELPIISCTEASGYGFVIDKSDNTIRFYARAGNNAWAYVSYPCSSVTAGRHYWNLIYNATAKKLYMYKDGSEVASGSTYANTITYNTNVLLRVGGEPSTGTAIEYATYSGKIGNLIITNDATVRSESSTYQTAMCPNQALTMYAAWEAETYTISYNANGGSSTPASQTKTYGVALTLQPAITKTSTQSNIVTTFNATANGGASNSTKTSVKTQPYTFNKWAEGSASGTTTYAASGSFTANRATTLYATWTNGTATYTSITFPVIPSHANGTATKTVTTSFNWNGAQGTSTTPTAKTSTATATVTYSANKWWTSQSSGTSYSAGTAITPTAAATYYAQYTASTGTYSAYSSITMPAAPTTVKAPTTATKYVNYDGNGGTPTAVSTAFSQTTNYSFGGWTTSSSGTSGLAAGAAFTPTANGTRYCAWPVSSTTRATITLTTIKNVKPAVGTTGTLTYNANGGNAVTASNYNISTAQTMNGWYTAASGGTKAGNAGASYTPPVNGTTLYAQWANNGTTYASVTLKSATRNDTTATKYVNYDKNTGTTVSSASTSFIARTTYSLDKWHLGSTTGTAYSAGATYNPTGTSATMYATWNSGVTAPQITTATATKDNTTAVATLTYNAGTGGSVSPTSKTYTVTSSWSGTGWYTAASSGTKRANMGGSYTPPVAGETVYAQWSESKSGANITLPTATKTSGTANKTLTYNGNGGTPTIASTTYVVTTSYTNTEWRLGSASGTKLGNAGASVAGPTTSTTVYAYFTSQTTSANVTLTNASKITTTTGTLTYNANGGTPARASDNYNVTTTYALDGWYTAASGGTKVGNAGASYAPPTGGTTVYAQWASTGTSTYAAVTLPNVTPPTGKVIDGWYNQLTGGTKVGNVGASYTPTASAATVYMHYTASTYSVTYDTLGGLPQPPAQTKSHGTNLTLTNRIPVKSTSTTTITCTFNYNNGTSGSTTTNNNRTSNYSFQYWNLNSTTGPTYPTSGTYSIDADAIFYANYDTENSYSSTTSPAAPTAPSNTSRTVVVNYDYGYDDQKSTQNVTLTTTYSFRYWTPTTGSTVAASTSIIPTQNMTYTATWLGTEQSTNINLPTINRTGYRCTGWYYNNGSQDVRVGDPGASYTVSDSTYSRVLFAKWEKCCYVFYNNQWRAAIPYVFTSGAWHKAEPYTFDGTSWK